MMTERLSKARFNSINIPELIGLCRGVLADGTINTADEETLELGELLEEVIEDPVSVLIC